MIKKVIILFTIALFCGCNQPKKAIQPQALTLDPNITIAQLAEVFNPQTITVEGYAIVGGLPGTGSSDIPTQIQNYLQKYISNQLPQGTDTKQFMQSRNTAAVKLSALMPASRKNQS